jgi:hypothetical protein
MILFLKEQEKIKKKSKLFFKTQGKKKTLLATRWRSHGP